MGWDLETKDLIHDLVDESVESGKAPTCLSIAWSHDGQTLYAGYSDNVIRVWRVRLNAAGDSLHPHHTKTTSSNIKRRKKKLTRRCCPFEAVAVACICWLDCVCVCVCVHDKWFF